MCPQCTLNNTNEFQFLSLFWFFNEQLAPIKQLPIPLYTASDTSYPLSLYEFTYLVQSQES